MLKALKTRQNSLDLKFYLEIVLQYDKIDSANINFNSFSELTKILTILMLILSKVTPISILALIKYRFIK